MTDIEIAQAAKPKDIYEIAKKLEIPLDYVVPYGKYKAKIDYHILGNIKRKPGKLILMTAINPTPAGEGKTTVTVGLADALNHLGKKCTVALREPSLGPVFGIKGGAAGGGRAQVIPMEDINLHFTGDFHAISSANNLLAAMLDAHIFHGNELGIDTNNITWKRAVDMNDRQLRHIRDGLGGNKNGIERNDGFDITVASEIMAIFCLSTDISDLKKNLSKIVVAYTKDNKPVTAHDLHAEGALTALLKDAINPNLVQSLEGTPAFIHGGPFANIAHGCNSVMATKMAMQLSDYTITEAGFGADLGAEKFFDIKCRLAEIKPDASVVVASCRALKNHGGVKNEDLAEENLTAIETGIQNLFQHVQNIQNEYCLPCLVAINVFSADSKAEIKLMEELCSKNGIETAITNVWEKGGNGGIDLAKKLVSICENGDTKGHSRKTFKYLYDSKLSIKEKIECIAKKIYHANGVNYIHNSEEEIQRLEKLGFGNMPVCIAKTQYSFSDDASKLGAPTNFNISIRNVKVNAGAGFIVALTGTILTLPGLGKKPAAFNIDVDNNGVISGLF